MRELQLLIKPVSSACDLDCTYCFYKDEAANRAVGDHGTRHWRHRRPACSAFRGESRHSQVCPFLKTLQHM